MVVIEAVDERSPAARLGLQKGDRLVSLNRQEINDVLDYEFYANDSGLRLSLIHISAACGQEKRTPFCRRFPRVPNASGFPKGSANE